MYHREKTAFGLAFFNVWINESFELMIYRASNLDSVKRFSVFCVCFASSTVAYSGSGHEIAFVSSVDKRLAAERLVGKSCDRFYCGARLFNALFSVKSFRAIEWNLIFFYKPVKSFFRDAGFEYPHRFRLIVNSSSALAGNPIFTRHRLERPSFVTLVILPQTVIELS